MFSDALRGAIGIKQDLEGIVAKWKDAPYNPAPLPFSWLKVKNPHYSQGRDRHELFERL